MFTGIIESVGKVKEIKREGTNIHFCISSEVSSELKVDQSISHNGVCLTVTEVNDQHHWVTAIQETLDKSNLGDLNENHAINLERCMKADGRFDGHIVQGHVDTTAIVTSIEDKDGSWVFTFELKDSGAIVEKGSVCINGTSLTCFDVNERHFSVAIIPYTFEHTNFHQLAEGSRVNIEFDILGKYIQQIVNRSYGTQLHGR